MYPENPEGTQVIVGLMNKLGTRRFADGIEGCANNGVFLDISDIARDCIMYMYENSAINR